MSARATFHRALELDFVVTPEMFRAAFPEPRASTFVLDGGGASARPRLDRAAFMGAAPSATFRARRTTARDDAGRVLADVEVRYADGRSTMRRGVDAFAELHELVSASALPADGFDDRYPFAFRGGLVGYIGYECGQLLERLPCLPRPSAGMPDIAFALHDWVIATRRDSDRSWLSVVGRGPSIAEARADAEVTREWVVAALRNPEARSVRSEERQRTKPRITATLTAAEYMSRVAIAKEHIAAGDTFEICLTTAHRAHVAQDQAWPLFEELRRSNPAPFAALLDLPEGAVVSSSPERFLSLDASGVAESRPIKGTRPRGATAAEDDRLARELAASEKDRAENAMIVDLVRNDLGRVCRFGTVEVPELFAIEPYATVHQLVSTVRGQLTDGCDAIELVRACFPPGSMTGAPKIEAMSILEHLEPVERGVYSGALGWMDVGGAMDLSVVIRTVVLKDDVATFSVGGAVVADSDPRGEHEEAEQKARALVRAIETIAHPPRSPERRSSPDVEQHA